MKIKLDRTEKREEGSEKREETRNKADWTWSGRVRIIRSSNWALSSTRSYVAAEDHPCTGNIKQDTRALDPYTPLERRSPPRSRLPLLTTCLHSITPRPIASFTASEFVLRVVPSHSTMR